ncbi:MAG TPA: putative zinc-binding protein [Anaerolineae bacterium]|nr:putative zinc-binding protein [Anaerolineae bacterium]
MSVIIVPCSGIGKTYGTVTREAAYLVVDELRPDDTQIVPLSLLVLGDADAQAAVRDAQVITLDGCKLACATVNVGQAGGAAAREFTVLDCYRRHKDMKPQGIAELNAGGLALARALAEEVAQAAVELEGGQHA